MKFEIPALYKFHTKKSVSVEVDLIRVDCSMASRECEALWTPVPLVTVEEAEEMGKTSTAGRGRKESGKGKGGKGGKGAKKTGLPRGKR